MGEPPCNHGGGRGRGNVGSMRPDIPHRASGEKSCSDRPSALRLHGGWLAPPNGPDLLGPGRDVRGYL